jgi:hypothetical protein
MREPIAILLFEDAPSGVSKTPAVVVSLVVIGLLLCDYAEVGVGHTFMYP